MSEEELNNLLDIGCCIYHDKLCEKAHNYILEMQDKIDKAIEYCKTMYTYGIRNNREQAEELLKILGGKNE